MVTEYKNCTKCHLQKIFPDDFASGKSFCKQCRNFYLKSKRAPKLKSKQSSAERLLKIKEWQRNNPTRRQLAIQKYHASHLTEEKRYYQDNKHKILTRIKNWKSSNKEHTNAWTRHYRQQPIIKLRHTVSVLIRFYLKGIKSGSVINHLPYSIEELKLHLEKQFEPWMSWSNWGVYRPEKWNDDDPSTWTWQLDHIIPHSSFIYTSMKDLAFQECWSLSNLRPLSAKKNILEGARKISVIE